MDIRPSSDLRNKYNEVATQCKESREPVYITVNGRGDTVLMDINVYSKMKAELELLKMLSEAEEDARNNRVNTVENVFQSVRNKLGVDE